MAILQLDSENADRDLTSSITVLTDTPDASNHILCQAYIELGDGAKNLDGTGGNFELVVTVGGQTVQPSPQIINFGMEMQSSIWSTPFPVPSNNEVILKIESPNGADTDVDVTAYLFDVQPPAIDANGRVDVSLIEGVDATNQIRDSVVDDATRIDASSVNVIEAKVDIIAGYLDTEIAAIIAAVITNAAGADIAADIIAVKAETALIVADTDELQGDWVDGGRLDLLLDAIKLKTDNQPAGVPKNVALSNFKFLMVLSSDHITPATGKVITSQISKDGGAFAGTTNAVAEISNGVYKIDLIQAEMNAAIISLIFTEATCDQRTITIKTSL